MRGMIFAVATGLMLVGAGKGQPIDYSIPQKVQDAAQLCGMEYCICPELLEAIAFKESSYNPDAVNGNCVGLMQINLDTQQDRIDQLQVTDIYNTYQNMRVAADYITELSEQYDDLGTVLMIYNGDSNAKGYEAGEKEMSEYADETIALAEKLEREHGK